ncbi:MAG: hypothetical protein WBW61_07465, partial [Rhodanobacteraceae bacterium]
GYGLSRIAHLSPMSPTHSVTSDVAPELPVLLPTVHVHPGANAIHYASMQTLPAVIVHPDAADVAAVAAKARTDARIAANVVAAITPMHLPNAAAGASHAPLNMPYYSFGKAAPRMSRD